MGASDLPRSPPIWQLHCLPFSLMAHSSSTQAPSNISVWCATGSSIWILRLTQLCDHSWLVLPFRVKQFVKSHDLANRLHTHIWLLKTYAIPASMHASQIWASPFLRQDREMNNPLQIWPFDSAEKDNWGHRHHSFMVRCARVRPGAPAIQLFLRCNAFIQFPYPMQQFHDEEGFASWHAIELQVSWLLVLSHSFSHGRLTQFYMHVQIKVVELWARPYTTSRFVVDLRDRHLGFWTPFFDGCHDDCPGWWWWCPAG